HVTLIDRDADLMRLLEEGQLPIYEYRVDELFQRSRAEGTLALARDSQQAVADAKVVFLCVAVPPLENGESDFAALDAAAGQIARAEPLPRLIVLRSTAPVQTGKQLKHMLTVYGRKREPSFSVAANPPFLREGTAVEDFLHPER